MLYTALANELTDNAGTASCMKLHSDVEQCLLLSGGSTGGWSPPPPQTCSAHTMLGRYKISLMSSYLELGHAHAT